MNEQQGYLLALIAVMVMVGVGAVLAPSSAILVIGFGSMVGTSLLSLLAQSRAAVKVAEVAAQTKVAAVKVAEVASTARIQDVKLDVLSATAQASLKQGNQIHELVNSNMGVQLQVAMVALRRLADLTQDPADVAIADNATKLYAAHQAQQALMDAHATSASNPAPTIQKVEIVSAQAPVPVQVVDPPAS